MMECPICLDSDGMHAIFCVNRCATHVCEECAVGIMDRSAGRCPFCRSFVMGFVPPLQRDTKPDLSFLKELERGIRRDVQTMLDLIARIRRTL